MDILHAPVSRDDGLGSSNAEASVPGGWLHQSILSAPFEQITGVALFVSEDVDAVTFSQR